MESYFVEAHASVESIVKLTGKFENFLWKNKRLLPKGYL